MKTIFRLLSVASLVFMLSAAVFSQSAPPPPANHGQTTHQEPGGAAPIGSGTLILLTLGALYGVHKIYKTRKQRVK